MSNSNHSEYGSYFLEDLEVGMTAIFSKTISESDIYLFAGLSGDTNPAHLNEEFASQTRFKKRIAHGLISAGFISAVLGTKLPGPGTIWVNQTLKFKAPVYIGDTVVACVTIKEIVSERQRAFLDTICSVADKVVLEGEAEIWVPRRPAS